jgi:hypothetical protein
MRRELVEFILRRYLLFPLILILTAACSNQNTKTSLVEWQTICGRNSGDLQRTPLYRAKVPKTWIRQDPSPLESNEDTTKSICKFEIYEGSQVITVTIHNFPSANMQQRIPPLAQIHRWKKQFDSLEPGTLIVTPQAYSGFIGLVLEGTGLLKGKRTSILAWAMQLAPEHYQNLLILSPDGENALQQELADFSIKAVGPADLMQRHKQSVLTFARSFELIDELPL